MESSTSSSVPELPIYYAFSVHRSDKDPSIPSGLSSVQLCECHELGNFLSLITPDITKLNSRFPKPVETGIVVQLQLEASRQNLKALCGTELISILEKQLNIVKVLVTRLSRLKDPNTPGVKRKETWLKLKINYLRELTLALMTCCHIGNMLKAVIPSYTIGYVNSSNITQSILNTFESPARLYERLQGELTPKTPVCIELTSFATHLSQYIILVRETLDWIRKHPESQI